MSKQGKFCLAGAEGPSPSAAQPALWASQTSAPTFFRLCLTLKKFLMQNLSSYGAQSGALGLVASPECMGKTTADTSPAASRGWIGGLLHKQSYGEKAQRNPWGCGDPPGCCVRGYSILKSGCLFPGEGGETGTQTGQHTVPMSRTVWGQSCPAVQRVAGRVNSHRFVRPQKHTCDHDKHR